MGHVRLVYGDDARPFTWRFLTVQVLEQFGIVVECATLFGLQRGLGKVFNLQISTRLKAKS